MFICTCQDSLVSLFPMGNVSSRLSCFHCISSIPTCIWRVEFKVEESAFWVLLNLTHRRCSCKMFIEKWNVQLALILTAYRFRIKVKDYKSYRVWHSKLILVMFQIYQVPSFLQISLRDSELEWSPCKILQKGNLQDEWRFGKSSRLWSGIPSKVPRKGRMSNSP